MHGFSIPIRVYIEDTDAGGVVYYANYLKYMERARTEWLRGLGFELDEWQVRHRTLFVVRSLIIEYRQPARFNDQLEASLELETLKRASLVCSQAIMRGESNITTAKVTLACVNADTLSPQAIPNPFREAMKVER